MSDQSATSVRVHEADDDVEGDDVPEVLKPGIRLFSAVCSAEMIVVRAPAAAVELLIGGVAPARSAVPADGRMSVHAGHDGGSLVGKRYTDSASSIELLCTKAGTGVPSLNGELLQPKDAKKLPSSD